MFRITGYHKMQIGLGVLLVAAVLLTLVAAAWPMMTVQAAGGTEGSAITAGCGTEWRDTGICCECWWPGPQDLRQQWLVCPDGRQEPLGYYKCACPSWCSYH